MEYKTYYAVHDFEDNIARDTEKEGFNPSAIEVATRMYYCMKLLGEIDRLYKIQPTYPTVIQLRIQDSIDRLNQAVKKLSQADIPGKPAEFSQKDNHPYIDMLNKFKDNGLAFDRAVIATASAVGLDPAILTRWYADNGISDKTYIVINDESYKAGVNAAKINNCIEDMYEKAKPYMHDASSYLSFMKGFSEVSGIKEDTWYNNIQSYVTQYSESFDTDIMSKVVKLIK